MIKRLFVFLGVTAAFAFSAVMAQEDFRITRLGEKAALFQIGREDPTNIVALASRRGLVVIDTGVLPSRAAALRSAVEREFKRRDFGYVVNTHGHFDHTDGNQAFTDVPIVAHQNAVREMTRSLQSPEAIAAFLQSRSGYQKELEGELKTAAAGSRDETRIREQMAENAALMDDFRQGRLVLTKPTLLFSDRLTLDLDDLTLDLVYYGRAHTESDILIHIPELRLLIVGDLFSKDWFPSFGVGRPDVPRGFQALDGLPGGLQTVERVIGGHGEPMSGDDFRAQAVYLRGIWEGVAAARRDGLTLAATKERLPFDDKSPVLSKLIRTWRGYDLHLANVEAAWRLQSESAAQALESLIAARGLEAAAAEYRKTIAGNERYNVAENELNALGYRFLQNGRPAEAIAVFEIIVEAFPRSWNAWDSLAEGHLSREDRDKAEEFYRKSVELNPGNQNGKNQLNLIQGRRLDLAGETKEILRFKAGAQTGLQGPYLGLKTPGLRPEVFAPGIVSSAKAIEFGVTFSPDGKEMYFTRRIDGGQNTIMESRWEKEGWTAPEETAFTEGFPSNEPYITPDGRKLYYGCNRTRPGADRAEYAIWVVERTAAGAWGKARYHGPGMFVSAARNGALYMTDVAGLVGRDRPVVVYPWTGDRYGAPQRLGGGVNAPAVADHAYVPPDESYVLFDSPNRPGGQGGYGDLYICYKKPDGAWGEALNLGDDVNTPATQFGPMVTPDGKYIFYCTRWDIYWVSAEVIERLRPLKTGLAPAAGEPEPALSQTPEESQDGSVIGNWQGVIQLGGRKFTFVFKFSSDAQKGIKGLLDLPEQDERDVPVDEIKITGNSVYLDIKKIQRKFEGEISADKKKIAGVYIRDNGMRIPLTLEKTDSVFAMKRPQLPQPPYPYKEDPDVVVNGTDQAKLAGTLTIPEGTGPFPAIILISGSGAQDRDETMFGHKPFLVLADYFTRRGAAVLRCDDRGAGKSGGEHLAATTAIRAADVGHMMEYLLTRKEINREKIFLLGHSEGTVIGSLAASRNPLVAGMILLGAPGISIEENLYLQNRLIRKADGAADAAIAQAEALQRNIFSVVKDVADDAEAQTKLRAIYSSNMYERLNDSQKKSIDERIGTVLTPYFRDIIQYDPAAALAKISCPVLAIIGEKDLQCPPKENIPALEKALRAGGNQRFRVLEMEGLNHMLQTSASGAMSEYASIEETISPRVLAAISDWLLSIKEK